MRNFSYFILFMSLLFIDSACYNESEPMVSNQTRIIEDAIIPYYSEVLQKPVLVSYTSYIDTLTTWGFYVQIPEGGWGGSCKQLQYYSGLTWRDVKLSYTSDISVEKQGYPYGDVYFRARTLLSERFAKEEHPSIYEASPWSEPLHVINRLLEDGTPYTEKDFIIQLVFTFHSRNGVYTIKKAMFDKFKAELKVDNKSYLIKAPFGSDQVNGCSFVYNYSTQKGSAGGLVVAFDIIDRCEGGYVSFLSTSESFRVEEDATKFTPIKIYNIDVAVYN